MMDLYNFRRKQEYSSTNDKMRQLSENKNQEIMYKFYNKLEKYKIKIRYLFISVQIDNK